MDVYALVGLSGTGKSYKALELAYDKNIEYIIDDGILIYKNKILSGISAKQANTKMEAVRRAIFLSDYHRKEVKSKIQQEQVNKILIIGTSKKMVNQIANRLEISNIKEYIYIEDISTEQEREKARLSRKKGNHIIPVPTIEIKSIMSGLKIRPLKINILKGKNEKERILEKTIIRPTFSYLGKFYISINVIREIIKYEIGKFDYIDKVNKIDIINTNSIIKIYIDLNITDMHQIKNCNKIQKQIKESIENITSINVEMIDIYVNKLKKR